MSEYSKEQREADEAKREVELQCALHREVTQSLVDEVNGISAESARLREQHAADCDAWNRLAQQKADVDAERDRLRGALQAAWMFIDVAKVPPALARQVRATPPPTVRAPMANNRWPTVDRFAAFMRQKLDENEHKGGWECEDEDWLLDRIQQELNELREAWEAKPRGSAARTEWRTRIVREAADVANMAMMLADVCGALPVGQPALAEAVAKGEPDGR